MAAADLAIPEVGAGLVATAAMAAVVCLAQALLEAQVAAEAGAVEQQGLSIFRVRQMVVAGEGVLVY